MDLRGILPPTHPIFRIPATRIFWIAQVQKINQNGSMSPRILVISQAGLFLIDKRTFPRRHVVSRHIIWRDLVFIQVEDERITMCMARVTMILQHPDVVNILAIILSVRHALFGDKPRPPTLKIPDGLMSQVNLNKWLFESPCLIADRFLSLCAALPEKLLFPDQINDIYEQLKNDPTFVNITSEMLSSGLVGPLAQAIAYDNEVLTLRLKNLDFFIFSQYLNEIFTQNDTLQELIFSAVSFRECPLDLFSKTKVRVSKWIFSDCPLNSKGASIFFELFKVYPGVIDSLSFISCNFRDEVVENVIMSILTMPCFKSLKELCFIAPRETTCVQSQIIQFSASDYLNLSHNLKKLVVDSSSIQIEIFLPYFTTVDNGILTVDLSGNFLHQPLPTIDDFHQIGELSLSRTTMTGSTLLSFFKTLQNSERSPSVIVLDNLKISDTSWKEFYNRIDEIQVPAVGALSWKENKIQTDATDSFCSFLERHLNIIDLDLSGCFLLSNATTQIPRLCKMFQTKRIERLVMRGVTDSVFSELLIPILRSLLSFGVIKCLDVTGQQVGDSGIEVLVQLAQHSLESLLFDNSLPQKLENYLMMLKLLAESRLVSAAWPREDARNLIMKLPVSKRASVSQEIENVHKMFDKKVGLDQVAEVELPTKVRRESVRTRRSADELSLENISGREKFVADALLECFGDNIPNEPLLTIIQELDEATSISTYLKSL